MNFDFNNTIFEIIQMDVRVVFKDPPVKMNIIVRAGTHLDDYYVYHKNHLAEIRLQQDRARRLSDDCPLRLMRFYRTFGELKLS